MNEKIKTNLQTGQFILLFTNPWSRRGPGLFETFALSFISRPEFDELF